HAAAVAGNGVFDLGADDGDLLGRFGDRKDVLVLHEDGALLGGYGGEGEVRSGVCDTSFNLVVPSDGLRGAPGARLVGGSEAELLLEDTLDSLVHDLNRDALGGHGLGEGAVVDGPGDFDVEAGHDCLLGNTGSLGDG